MTSSKSGFTDDDFKRLKNWKSLGFQPETAWDVNEMMDLLDALLARLETAEKVIAAIASESLDGVAYFEAMEAWRKAAGKL